MQTNNDAVEFNIEKETPAETVQKFWKITTGEKALQFFKNCTVEIDLSLEVWDIEDRKVSNKNYKKKPFEKFPVLFKEVLILEPMNTFDHMNYIQN